MFFFHSNHEAKRATIMKHSSGVSDHRRRILFHAIFAVIGMVFFFGGCNLVNDPPAELAILSVTPNPFSDTIKVVYSVVSSSSFSRLRIVISNRDGTVIKTLVDETPKNGIYTITWSGKKLAGGFYFVEMLGWFGDIAMSKVMIFREGEE